MLYIRTKIKESMTVKTIAVSNIDIIQYKELMKKKAIFEKLHKMQIVRSWFWKRFFTHTNEMTGQVKYNESKGCFEAWLFGLMLAEGTYDDCKQALAQQGEIVD
jgi:hypothetical protein